MRQLHVLGVSDEGDTLLLGTTAQGKVTHRLPLDGRLRQAVRGQLAAPGSDRAESVLSPKEIQARLRAGATPDEVAKVARVPVARVMPYFAPVEAERERIVEEARRAVLHRNRGPQPTQPLGEVVDARLREVAGLKEDSVTWTARRRADGAWVVRLAYAVRGSRRRAEWLWQPAGRALTALDASASRLAAEGEPARKKPARRPAVAATKSTTRKAARPAKPAKSAKSAKAAKPAKAAKAAKPARAAQPAKPAKVTASRPAKAAPARPKTTTKATQAAKATKTTKPTRTTTATKPSRATKTTRSVKPRVVVRPTVAPEPLEPIATTPVRRRARRPAVAAVAPAPPRVRAPKVRQPRVLEVVPDPEPVEEPTPVVVEPAPAVRKPGTRVPVPSWSDVLLGVAPGAAAAADPAPPTSSSGGRRRRT